MSRAPDGAPRAHPASVRVFVQACVQACVCRHACRHVCVCVCARARARVSLRRARRTDAHEEEEDEENVHDGQQRESQRRHDLAQRLHLQHSMVSFVFIFCMYASLISTSCNVYTAVIYIHMYVYNTPRLLSCASSRQRRARRAWSRVSGDITPHHITSCLISHHITSCSMLSHIISYHILLYSIMSCACVYRPGDIP